MTFFYNENACRVIIDINSKQLEMIRKNLDFLEHELDIATEPAVRFAIEEAIARRKYDEASTQLKISEMDLLLSGLSQP